ncbi:hypothetical protein HNQ91_000681 [Filimonas zeae]|uniref:Uncharacterized protein n=1 Tax=Filimonas zeae TaxID=1737353 RepID=A0A917IRM6_9BACT|nr:hypothetical protein [Filimonas zeae]MDR6337659.1 hypothetical protein [Filimonas zeae]GGH59670.1 hypothetical protein GCM10011379_06700 [Filimonas zeae]
MSTLMLSFEVFEAIASTIDRQHVKHGLNKITWFDCRDLTRKKINDLVTTWCDLNEWSYVAEYKTEEEFNTLSELLDLTIYYTGISAVQLFKWLGALIYNIDIEQVETMTSISDEQRSAFSTLQQIYTQLANTIVHDSEEYAKAYYSDYPAEHRNTITAHPDRKKGTRESKKPQLIELTIQANVQVQTKLPNYEISRQITDQTTFYFNLPAQIEVVKVVDMQTNVKAS